MYNLKVSKWHALREIEYDIYIYIDTLNMIYIYIYIYRHTISHLDKD